MKKIVALVLAMVMVLGLATTAFGAMAGKGGAGAVDTIVKNTPAVDGYDAWRYELDEKDEADDEDQTFATYEVVAYALYKGAKTWWDGGKTTADEAGDDYDVVLNKVSEFVKVLSAEAADLVIIDGNEITYLADANKVAKGWALKAEEVYFGYTVPEKRECDTLYAPTAAGQFCYEDAKGNLYVEDNTKGTFYVSVDGAAVLARDAKISDETYQLKATKAVDPCTYDKAGVPSHDLIYTGHVYEADSKGNSYTEAALEKVYCDACGTSFKYVVGPQSLAIKTFGEDYYNAGTWGATLWVGTAVAATPDAPEAGDKVESAETFDAGIAMYVGMSVMAAAGSAVVLKKKD